MMCGKKGNIRIELGDCIEIENTSYNSRSLGILADISGSSSALGVVGIHTIEGPSLISKWAIVRNLGNQGFIEEIIKKYPEYFL